MCEPWLCWQHSSLSSWIVLAITRAGTKSWCPHRGQGCTHSISARAQGSREVPLARADILCLPTVVCKAISYLFAKRQEKALVFPCEWQWKSKAPW